MHVIFFDTSFYVLFFSSQFNSLCALFQNVNNLSMETRRVVKGNHSRKTGNFVRVKIFDRKIYVEKKIKNDAFTCHMKIPLVLKFDWFFLQACTANCYIHVCSLSYSELREFDCFSLSRPVRRTAIFMSVVYFTPSFLNLTCSLSPGLCGILLYSCL